MFFLLQSQEASELFRVGQLRTGPLSRQQGESMLSYVSRRKRWWVTLQELDGETKLSEAMRANLLVELRGLQRSEQLLVGKERDRRRVRSCLDSAHRPGLHARGPTH